MANCEYFIYPNRVQLESGKHLDGVKIAYNVFGNPDANQTVWVCHALSGNSNVLDWWAGLFGDLHPFNLKKYKIICANAIGSCYGSTGPDDFEDVRDFPLITIRDIVKGHQLLADFLGVEQVDVLIGSSLGGQQALEWSIIDPDFSKKLVLIATNAVHSPFGRAFNEAQRLALVADPTFGKQYGGVNGLIAARAVAMLSYRSYEDFSIKQADKDQRLDAYRASSYVTYQGEKFVQRFKPGAYFTLSKAMDSHDVARGRGRVIDALSKVQSKTLVVGVDSDMLFPISEQKLLANQIPGAELEVIESPYGHDAFLIEYEQLNEILENFLNEDKQRTSSKKNYEKRPTKLKPQSN